MPRRKRFLARSRGTDRDLVYLFGALILLGFIVAIVKALLPLIILGGFVGGGFWLWNRWRKESIGQRERLNATFHKLLQEHQGRISILDFSIATSLDGKRAKEFLDTRAKEFSADFEVTERGEVVYVFRSLKISPPEPPI
jgi:hypothetical protein